MALDFLLPLASGFMQGKGGSRKQAMTDELHMAQANLIKQQGKAAEAALTMQQLKDKIFSGMSPEEQKAAAFPKADDTLESKLKTVMNFMGQGGGQPSPQPSAPPLPFGGGTEMFPLDPSVTQSLPEQIAQGQMGGLEGLGLSKEDLMRGVLKKELGAEGPKYNRFAEAAGPGGVPWVVPMDDRGNFDWAKALPKSIKAEMQKGMGEGMAPTETPVNPYTRQPVGAPIQTGPPPMMEVGTPTPGGGRVTRVLPKFPSLVGDGTKVTGTTGGVRTELDLVDIPIPASETLKWSDGAGNNPPAGWTPKQAQARGFKLTPEGMAAESGGKAVMVAQALQDIEAAEKMFFPPGRGFNRSLAISAQMGLPEWLVEGAQTAVSMTMNAAAAKLRIETGATARPEEQKDVIARFIPSWKDNEKSARGKMVRFKEFMRAGKFILDPRGRIVIVEPQRKPDLSLGKKRDPSVMTNDELLKALR